MEQGRRESLYRSLLAEMPLGDGGEGRTEPVLARNGFSVAELEAEFGDFESCLQAAYWALRRRVLNGVEAAADIDAAWPERVRAGLEALLAQIAAEPDLAAIAMRVFPASSDAAHQQYVDFLSEFERLLAEGRDFASVGSMLPEEIELLAIGAAESLIFMEVEAGRATSLVDMASEILFSLLVPFLGPERAGEEIRKTAPRPGG